MDPALAFLKNIWPITLVESVRLIEWSCAYLQLKLYQSVIDDVIAGTREAFLDEGVDEQVQQELRMLWESKLVATRAVETESQGPSTANGKSKDYCCGIDIENAKRRFNYDVYFIISRRLQFFQRSSYKFY